jgi:hypothetical protein
MIYPTISVMTSGVILVAMLLAADWFVWRLATARNLSKSHPVNPRGMGGAVEGEPSTIPMTVSSAHADRQGFKRVA